jgi:hypothetical protein
MTIMDVPRLCLFRDTLNLRKRKALVNQQEPIET